MFVETTFPRMVRMGEKDLYPNCFPEFGMSCELFAVIDCESLLVALRDLCERMACSTYKFRGALVLERISNKELGLAVNEGPDVSLFSSSFDGVAFPIPDSGLFLDHSGTLIDETAIRDDATPILSREPFATFLAPLAKVLPKIFPLPNACVYMLVDRFIGNVHFRLPRVFQFETAGDLFG